MYEQHFGLATKPFALTPDARFLYPSRRHSMALTMLEYGLESQAPLLLLVETETLTQCALIVDAVHDQRQVVIKGLESNYGAIPGVSAATVLGDGQIALILDAEALTSNRLTQGHGSARAPGHAALNPPHPPHPAGAAHV